MKPILFNTDMVRLILDGKKNQTRRPIKPQPINMKDGNYIDPYNKKYNRFTVWTRDNKMCLNCGGNIKGMAHWKPAYLPGDILYVRETWQKVDLPYGKGFYGYKAESCWRDDVKWKPSIHMPKEAARIFLKVTDVRVERLEDISDIGCEAEGIRPSVDGNGQDWRENENGWHRTFRQEWDSIYKEKGYGWDTNPWVFVYKFVRGEGE